MEIKTVGVACDHAGYPLKQFVIQYLEEHKYAYKDFGCNSDLSCDYPDYAHPLAEAIESGEVYPGIAICGSGEGMAIALNKHQGVRAGLVFGLNSFGFSAPYTVLDEKLGFTPENVYKQVKAFLA